MKNIHLRRYPHSSSLRRTSMYASLLGISGALHPDVFDQPARQIFLCDLLAFSGLLTLKTGGDRIALSHPVCAIALCSSTLYGPGKGFLLQVAQ